MANAKSWEKRLKGSPNDLTVKFVESLSYDQRLYKYDVIGSIAHVQMLAEQKIITKTESNRIKAGLLEIGEEMAKGKFKFDIKLEDIHMAIEAALIKRIGDVGKKLHTGRSRNDQIAVDMKLWMKDEIETIKNKVTSLQQAFVEMAEKYTDKIMPAYTHMQRAQPVSIAAYLLSFTAALERDFKRLNNCKKLVDESPLGSGAIAGSTINLDRKLTAGYLEFDAITINSIDSVGDRDFCAEFIFDCSLIATHLSQLAEDWIIYATSEFNFISIADEFCTSSSMMPQKRNPDLLELTRAKAAGVYGSLIAMLTILKGLPSGYNRDMQEDKLHVFSASDAVEMTLDVVTAIVDNTKFNTDIIDENIDEGFLDATALAEYLVIKNVPFRQGHQIVGEIVADCEKKSTKLADVTIKQYQKYCAKIEKDVYQYLGAKNVAKKYQTKGAGGTKQAKQQIKYWQKAFAKR